MLYDISFYSETFKLIILQAVAPFCIFYRVKGGSFFALKN